MYVFDLEFGFHFLFLFVFFVFMIKNYKKGKVKIMILFSVFRHIRVSGTLERFWTLRKETV